MKIILSLTLFALLVAGGVFYFVQQSKEQDPLNPRAGSETAFTTDWPEDRPQTVPPVVEEEDPVRGPTTIIGYSHEERPITAYHYGNGEEEVLLIGGMHGGYSWSTPLLAFQLMDYFANNPNAIPQNLTVTVIPVMNPDGLYKTVGSADRFLPSAVPTTLAETVPGRFNAREVDINRNFDCEWRQNAVWQDKAVSGGPEPFSEPESRALRDYVERTRPVGAVVWFSEVGGVFASNCHTGLLPNTVSMLNLYSDASGYTAHEVFDYYEITGDSVNWMSKINVPGISVLLTTHDDIEWEKNRAGVLAVLKHFER